MAQPEPMVSPAPPPGPPPTQHQQPVQDEPALPEVYADLLAEFLHIFGWHVAGAAACAEPAAGYAAAAGNGIAVRCYGGAAEKAQHAAAAAAHATAAGSSARAAANGHASGEGRATAAGCCARAAWVNNAIAQWAGVASNVHRSQGAASGSAAAAKGQCCSLQWQSWCSQWQCWCSQWRCWCRQRQGGGLQVYELHRDAYVGGLWSCMR